MKIVRLPASKTGAAYLNFEKTVLNPVSLTKLKSAMTVNEMQELRNALPVGTKHVSVWALVVTKANKNERPWKAMTPGDLGLFYTEKAFTHIAPIVYKWRNDNLEHVAGWKSRGDDDHYSLGIALGPVKRCNLGVAEYCALAGYDGLPVHSDVHDEATSAELLQALELGFAFGENDLLDDSANGKQQFSEEGDVSYRVQRLRERSDGNRLHVLEHLGHVCEVCGLDFLKQYGSDFKPSAHVHHKSPLALGKQRAKDVKEFAVLCAVCHTAIHMGPRSNLEPVDGGRTP